MTVVWRQDIQFLITPVGHLKLNEANYVAEIVVEHIDCDENGVDDVAVTDVSMFRLERMDKNHFWMMLYRDGRPTNIRFSIWARGKIIIHHEYESI